MFSTRRLAAPAALAAVALLVTGCGSSGDDGSAATDQLPAGAGPQAGQAGRFPGASGIVAQVSGNVVQVQSQMAGQVAVTIGSTTTVLDQVKATAADVEVGSCVVVRSSGTSGSTGSTTPPTAVTAATVAISPASGGSCGPGGAFGRPDGRGPRAMPSGVPSGMPTDRPSDFAGWRGGFGTVGKVTSVSGNGFTVASTAFGSSTTTDVAVTTTSATTYTEQQKAGIGAIKVGRCLTAIGSTDSTGAVTARTTSVSDAVDGQCPMVFGAPRPGGTP